MAIRLGATNITGLRLGATPITSVRLGTQLVWSASQLRDDFSSSPDGNLDPLKWVRELAGVNFDIGVVNGAARVDIPDDLLSVTWGFQNSRYRFIGATSDDDDGYLETRVVNKGTGGYATQLLRRYANSGGATGVGIQLLSSDLSIIRRVGSAGQVVKECGAFTPGDILRLIQVGNLHSLYRNGELAGEWDDVGATAAKGPSNRSIMMLMQGEKAILRPREFSPSIDYVEAS